MSTQENSRRRGTWLPFTAILLLALGILLLLNTTGVVGWGIWLQLFRFWPVILIAVGLNMILGRRFPVVSAILVVVILAAGIGVAYLFDRTAGPGQYLGESRHSWALDGINRLELEIEFGAGSLAIDSGVSPGADELFVVRATGTDVAVNPVPRGGGAGYRPLAMDGNVAVKLSPEASRFPRVAYDSGRNLDIDLWGPFYRLRDTGWDIGISPDVTEVKLDIEGGAAEMDLRLTDLNVKTLDMDIGAADVYIDLPTNAGHTDVYIDAGAADIDISVPDGVAALIKSDSGTSSIDIDDARFSRTGEIWQSPNYVTEQNTVEINIDAGASSVSIY